MELSERFMATLTDEQRAILQNDREHEKLLRIVEEDAQSEFEKYMRHRLQEEKKQTEAAEYLRSLMV